MAKKRTPKKDIVALVEKALSADLPLQTGATVAPPPVPEPQPEPVPKPQRETKLAFVKPHLRSIKTAVVGDARVQLIDTGQPNRHLGVAFTFADEKETPSPAVKSHLKEGDDPLIYRTKVKSWLIPEGEDPVATSTNVEMRFSDSVQALRAEKEGPSR